MGTNFYIAETNKHIGKSSHGWDFFFRGYKKDGLESWASWKKYLEFSTIVDEYAEAISFEVFVNMIETYKAPKYRSEDGRVNLNHNEVSGKADGVHYWNDTLGYAFSSVEFC